MEKINTDYKRQTLKNLGWTFEDAQIATELFQEKGSTSV